MKPNLLLVLCLVAFTGCSFSSNKVEYYLIDNKKDLSNAEKFSIPLVINKLKMPSYLDSKSMVFKLENNEVIKTSNHRWVDLLSSILDKSMKEYLLFDSKPTHYPCILVYDEGMDDVIHGMFIYLENFEN